MLFKTDLVKLIALINMKTSILLARYVNKRTLLFDFKTLLMTWSKSSEDEAFKILMTYECTKKAEATQITRIPLKHDTSLGKGLQLNILFTFVIKSKGLQRLRDRTITEPRIVVKVTMNGNLWKIFLLLQP